MGWLSSSSSTMSRRAWRISGELVCTSIPSQTCDAARGHVVAHALDVDDAHAARAGQAQIGMVAEPRDANPQLLGRLHDRRARVDRDAACRRWSGRFAFFAHGHVLDRSSVSRRTSGRGNPTSSRPSIRMHRDHWSRLYTVLHLLHRVEPADLETPAALDAAQLVDHVRLPCGRRRCTSPGNSGAQAVQPTHFSGSIS